MDVEDASAAAQFLVGEGKVDPKRLAIDGGSAGGYTTLACLTFTDVFTAGCSLYGVASLEALAGDTHKFESRYLDYLVSSIVRPTLAWTPLPPYSCSSSNSLHFMSLCLSLSQVGPYPEDVAIYKERAPIENLDKLSAPLILFQGLEDKIVPPNQAQMMYDICLEKKIPAALEMFEGEQHGFRKSENIRRCESSPLAAWAQASGDPPPSPSSLD